jgi:hypothetical protein
MCFDDWSFQQAEKFAWFNELSLRLSLQQPFPGTRLWTRRFRYGGPAVGFNAAWFAKIAFCILLALVAGFAGSLYLGAKLFAPVDEPAKLETRSVQSIAEQTSSAVPPIPRERTDVPAHKDVEPRSSTVTAHQPATPAEPNTAQATQSLPDVKHHATEPARNRASRDQRVGNTESELRLGQQERRRLRAERRRNLENANASQNKRLKKLPREDTRDEPFFPFRF